MSCFPEVGPSNFRGLSRCNTRKFYTQVAALQLTRNVVHLVVHGRQWVCHHLGDPWGSSSCILLSWRSFILKEGSCRRDFPAFAMWGKPWSTLMYAKRSSSWLPEAMGSNVAISVPAFSILVFNMYQMILRASTSGTLHWAVSMGGGVHDLGSLAVISNMVYSWRALLKCLDICSALILTWHPFLINARLNPLANEDTAILGEKSIWSLIPESQQVHAVQDYLVIPECVEKIKRLHISNARTAVSFHGRRTWHCCRSLWRNLAWSTILFLTLPHASYTPTLTHLLLHTYSSILKRTLTAPKIAIVFMVRTRTYNVVQYMACPAPHVEQIVLLSHIVSIIPLQMSLSCI